MDVASPQGGALEAGAYKAKGPCDTVLMADGNASACTRRHDRNVRCLCERHAIAMRLEKAGDRLAARIEPGA